MTFELGFKSFGAALVCSLSFAACDAQAQAIFGFRVGQDLRVAAKTHPRPSKMGEQNAFAVVKWDLPNGSAVSVTASPETGKIVFMEADWGGDAANAATDLPGLSFGASKLADIRRRFQSNGFAFKSNAVQLIGQDVVSFNCYQIKGPDDLIAVFVTSLPTASIPTVDGKPSPDLGKGSLQAIILADSKYLKGLWGEERLFDKGYQIDWK
jgi:hypothetical protein